MKLIFLAIVLLAATVVSPPVHTQTVDGCGSLRNAFGPFDFRDPVARRDSLPLVEAYHFTAEVESLKKGKSGYLMGDIDYTLRAFPNHHRALLSVGRYALNGGRDWPNPDVQTADCYFLRAIAFSSDDPVVHILFGNYLDKSKKTDQARIEYEEALRLAPESPEIAYNAGLFFVSVGNLERARELAKLAYDEGYPLKGLKDKIEAAEAAKSASKK